MWWDAVEAKHVELLHDQASNGAGVSPKPLWLLNNPEFIPDSAPLGRDRSTPEINQAAAAAGANRILTQSQPESAPRHSHISTTFIAAAFRPPLLPTPPLPLPPSTFAAIVAAAVATATDRRYCTVASEMTYILIITHGFSYLILTRTKRVINLEGRGCA